eukprot:TRINITY_DN4366_c2_g1_i4.p1 TRINITY_DN4366_c2_g1~~TRINITY_DN4366_c2_g1_i4.p1  ORF type:complete len:101 (+),score=9.31 TRINITY_DN4366_c2_g1_i4:346-648(+)
MQGVFCYDICPWTHMMQGSFHQNMHVCQMYDKFQRRTLLICPTCSSPMKQTLNLDGTITLIIKAKKLSCMLNLVDDFSTQPSCGATLVPAVYINASCLPL